MLTLFSLISHMDLPFKSSPEAHADALRCIENWLVGCVATQEDFGLDAVKLYAGYAITK